MASYLQELAPQQGCGNVWRFSYVAGENGGAAFLIIYLFAVIFIDLPLVIAELAIDSKSVTMPLPGCSRKH